MSTDMSDLFIEEMRAKLLELRMELESVAKSGDEASQVVQLDQARVGRLSRMDAMQAQAMSQASGRRREIMLQKIAAALERIDNDDYGICQTCEEMINLRRLEFDPTAALCIDCATQAEQQ
jgi:DnaK suppressor protein